jgi:hypothetical protein
MLASDNDKVHTSVDKNADLAEDEAVFDPLGWVSIVRNPLERYVSHSPAPGASQVPADYASLST